VPALSGVCWPGLTGTIIIGSDDDAALPPPAICWGLLPAPPLPFPGVAADDDDDDPDPASPPTIPVQPAHAMAIGTTAATLRDERHSD
jgi:hypothetical protein